VVIHWQHEPAWYAVQKYRQKGHCGVDRKQTRCGKIPSKEIRFKTVTRDAEARRMHAPPDPEQLHPARQEYLNLVMRHFQARGFASLVGGRHPSL